MKKNHISRILILLIFSTAIYSQSYVLRDNPSVAGVPTGTLASTFYQSGEKYGIGSILPNSSLFVKTLSGVGFNATLEIENGDNKPIVNPFAPVTVTAPTLAPFTFLVKRVVPTAYNTYGPTAYSTFTDFVIKDNGFIGINNSNPTARLHLSNGNFIIDNGNITLNNGLLIIGNGTNQFAVSSDGKIRAREIKLDLLSIPDYVFKPTYKLMPLPELKKYIALNHHLPNIKSETEYIAEGNIDLGEMNTKLLEKVEELTLYILQLEERINNLETKK